jgi:hypothetical protein
MLVTGKLGFSGILKLEMKNELDMDTQGLKLNVKQHITLVHQEVFKSLQYNGKPFKKFLQKNPPKPIEITFDINLSSDVIFCEGEKRVLVYFVTQESQDQLDILVQNFFAEYNLQKEFNELRPNTLDKGRKFHLSYANTTGNPGDSIAIVWDLDEEKRLSA